MTVNDLKIYTYGDDNNQPIIFVHGFPYDNTMWDKQVEHLKNNYYCITYDVRGLGASKVGDGQYTMEQYSDDLFGIINELKLQSPILCGLSMGGYLAFRALEKNQTIFKGAILCDTKAQSDSDEIKLIRANKIKMINEEGLSAFVESFVPTCFSENYQNNHTGEYDLVKSLSKTFNPIGVKGALIAMLSRTDSSNSLKKIKIPVLLLAGEFDTMTPPEMMKQIGEKIKNSKFKIVPNSGHMSPIENPDFVNSEIEDFILQIDKTNS